MTYDSVRLLGYAPVSSGRPRASTAHRIDAKRLQDLFVNSVLKMTIEGKISVDPLP